MSLSNMTRETYMQHRASIRANGARYTLPRIDCPRERADMAELEEPNRDHLHQRMARVKLVEESTVTAFKCTSPWRVRADGSIVRW